VKCRERIEAGFGLLCLAHLLAAPFSATFTPIRKIDGVASAGFEHFAIPAVAVRAAVRDDDNNCALPAHPTDTCALSCPVASITHDFLRHHIHSFANARVAVPFGTPLWHCGDARFDLRDICRYWLKFPVRKRPICEVHLGCTNSVCPRPYLKAVDDLFDEVLADLIVVPLDRGATVHQKHKVKRGVTLLCFAYYDERENRRAP
jgi:hypothetical protein